MQAFFGYLSGVFLIIGFAPYFRDIIRGKTKPERTTWLLWSVLILIAFVAQMSAGATWSLLLSGVDAFIVVGIFILSIPYGIGGLLKRDVISLCISLFGLTLWAFTHQPLIALLVTIVIDGLGTYLTVVKTYLKPQTETLFSWCMGTLAGLCGLLAVGSFSVVLAVYPAYIVAANISVVLAIVFGKRMLRT